MRFASMILAATVLAGCGGAIQQAAEKIQARDAATEAAVKRMIVVRGAEIPGHSTYTQLGSVEGFCGKGSTYEDDESVSGRGLKHSAYAKYGGQVDGIVNLESWFVVGNEAPGVIEPGASYGHLQCRGIAVRFAPTAASGGA